MSLLPFLHRLMNKESLPASDAREAMSVILRGEATTGQIAAFAVALRMKGETAAELLGLAQAMRASAIRVNANVTGEPLLDTCGTGGDGQSTLNVSTIAAFVVAGAGVRVAKHGNRSHSSQCGSADLLEALGARVDLPPAAIAQSVQDTGIGFLYAPNFHPALRYAAQARAELKTRTAFNLLGPLTNPAGATAQLVGAPSPQAAELMAVTLSSLGLQRGYVVHGHSGLDEISTTGPSILLGIMRGAIDHQTVTPEDFGLPRVLIEELRGGSRDTNREIALDVLDGGKSPYRDIVLANSAVALMAAGKANGLKEGVERAAHAIDTGAARQTLDRFIAFTVSWSAVSGSVAG